MIDDKFSSNETIVLLVVKDRNSYHVLSSDAQRLSLKQYFTFNAMQLRLKLFTCHSCT